MNTKLDSELLDGPIMDLVNNIDNLIAESLRKIEKPRVIQCVMLTTMAILNSRASVELCGNLGVSPHQYLDDIYRLSKKIVDYECHKDDSIKDNI